MLLLSLSLSFTGCTKEQDPATREIVARVRDQVLTSADMNSWELSVSSKELSPEVRNDFIRHWVEQELLYQEALTRNLNEDEWVVKRETEIKRQLLIARLLEVEGANITPPTADQVGRYFREHSSEFVRTKVHYIVDYWCSTDYYALDRLRANLLKGHPAGAWGGISGSLETGRLSIGGQEDLPDEVWRVVMNLNKGEISKLINSQKKYWLFRLTEKQSPGQIQDIIEVEDLIKARLVEIQRQLDREELIRSLMDDYKKSGRLEWNSTPVVSSGSINNK